jgi:single-stranded DNA-binding protein
VGKSQAAQYHNQFDVIGRVVALPKIRPGKKAAHTRADWVIAIPRRAGNITDYLDCFAYGATAENVRKFVRKGDPLHLTGQVELERWPGKGGKMQYRVRLHVRGMIFLTSFGAFKMHKPGVQPEATREEIDDEGDYEYGDLPEFLDAGNDDIVTVAP